MLHEDACPTPRHGDRVWFAGSVDIQKPLEFLSTPFSSLSVEGLEQVALPMGSLLSHQVPLPLLHPQTCSTHLCSLVPPGWAGSGPLTWSLLGPRRPQLAGLLSNKDTQLASRPATPPRGCPSPEQPPTCSRAPEWPPADGPSHLHNAQVEAGGQASLLFWPGAMKKRDSCRLARRG